MIRTKDTYRKLNLVFTGTRKECEQIVKHITTFPAADLVTCTRGNNDITYYRPNGGEYINDKVWMFHYEKNGSVSLYM